MTVNVINIVLGAAILAGSDLVKDVLVSYYSQGYQDLVPAMLLWRKPVLTFGTHSVAGFFLYLFFYINWQTYRVRGKRLFLAFAVCYLVLTLALLSVTGLLLSAVGAIQMLHGLWVSSKRRWLWTYGVAVAAAVVVMLEWDFLDRYGSDIVEGARAILTSPGNGLLGRLTPTGTMYGVVQYVMNHPFSPVGLSRDDNLLFADMGILDYLVRGSVILVVWVYGGLLLFLKRNLSAKADVYFLFAAIVAFELGYSVLLFYRIPLLLAFFVVYLNGLRQSQGAAPSLAPGRE